MRSGSTRSGPTTRDRGLDGRSSPRRTNATSAASMEPSVAVTGNIPGSRPAGASEGPAIMPIDSGGGALIEIARLLELRGAIATLPVNDRRFWSSTRNCRVSASSLRFSTGMTSRLSRDQSQAPPLGFKVRAGRSSVANTTRSLCPSFDSIVTCVGSTRSSSPAAVVISNRRAIAIEQRKPFGIMTWSPGRTVTAVGRRIASGNPVTWRNSVMNHYRPGYRAGPTVPPRRAGSRLVHRKAYRDDRDKLVGSFYCYRRHRSRRQGIIRAIYAYPHLFLLWHHFLADHH